MKRGLQNYGSTINERNEGPSSSRSRPTHSITSNADESETQIDSINETTDSNNEKRTNCLSWDDLFMAIASLIAKFGGGVGACIVDLDKKIVGIGFNGLLPNGYFQFGFSAEMNAILNKNSINVQNCTIYVSLYPCSERTKIIIQSGIKEVVYLKPSKDLASEKMFDASGIKIREHTPKQTSLNFNELDVKGLRFDDLYMTIAYLIAQRSKDPVTQVGACIVDSGNDTSKIISTGYNGMPTGCNDDDFPWGKSNSSSLHNKFKYVCHAEMNAVFYKTSVNVKGCTIYVSVFPCIECATIIIQSGIKKVVYFSDPKNDKRKNKETKKMFVLHHVEIKYHKPIKF